MQETQETGVQSLGQEDTLEKEMATHSSTIAWKIPWTEEPGKVTVVQWKSKWAMMCFEIISGNSERRKMKSS